MVCIMSGVLASCLSTDPGHLCQPCTLLEIGESLDDLRTRAGLGYTRGRYAKWKAEHEAALAQQRRRFARGYSRFE